MPSRNMLSGGACKISASCIDYGSSYSAARSNIMRPKIFENLEKMKILKLREESSRSLRMVKGCLGSARILSSASFWRGNQVDGLPRRFT